MLTNKELYERWYNGRELGKLTFVWSDGDCVWVTFSEDAELLCQRLGIDVSTFTIGNVWTHWTTFEDAARNRVLSLGVPCNWLGGKK